MAESATNPLTPFSNRLATLVEDAARSIVAVHGGRRWTTSGIHWRAGVVVTAEEALEGDDVAVTLPDGRRVAATLAGRDPSTDVAVLRFPPDGLPAATIGDAASLRAGNLVLAVGRHESGPIASLGIAGLVGAAWQSLRGGTIDRLVRLNLALSPGAEGGALIDTEGRVLGMTVTGPRRRALAIPASTIDRAVDQLLAKGHVARGYLGAGLQQVRLGAKGEAQRGILIVSLDPDGPATRAGLVVGDVITGWGDSPVARVREVMRLLGPDSVGSSVALQLLRGGNPTSVTVTLGERPLA